MQNQKDIRLTELPPPPVSAPKQPGGKTDLNDSPTSNLNTQKPQAESSYVNSRSKQNKLEDVAYLNDVLRPGTLQQKTKNGVYLNDAHSPKTSRENISDVNELYLEVDNALPPLQTTQRPTSAGKLFDRVKPACYATKQKTFIP